MSLTFLARPSASWGWRRRRRRKKWRRRRRDGRWAGSGAGWREVFLDAAEAACCDGVMRAVLAGHSVLELEAVASAEECAALVTEAGGLARRELDARDTTQCCRGGAVQMEAHPNSDSRPSSLWCRSVVLEELGLLDDVMKADTGRVRA